MQSLFFFSLFLKELCWLLKQNNTNEMTISYLRATRPDGLDGQDN